MTKLHPRLQDLTVSPGLALGGEDPWDPIKWLYCVDEGGQIIGPGGDLRTWKTLADWFFVRQLDSLDIPSTVHDQLKSHDLHQQRLIKLAWRHPYYKLVEVVTSEGYTAKVAKAVVATRTEISDLFSRVQDLWVALSSARENPFDSTTYKYTMDDTIRLLKERAKTNPEFSLKLRKLLEEEAP